VLVLIDRAESDPITFDEFSGAVRAGLHYDDLFKRARTLFDTCDPLHTGTIPRTTLQLVIRQVRSTDADAGAIAAAAAASASSSGGSSSGGSSSAAGTSAATRVGGHAELHRLQREVQFDNPNVSIEQTMVAAQKAHIGFQATLQVRNKLVQAYSEIMNLQV
jgi:flagellar hook-basal body complex protein FliE